ncbi:MAG: HNH endonuclease, partial [Desulfococcaceae bacterium]|nr:HNH endonuclease [Desulfococcaceae bacterium]
KDMRKSEEKEFLDKIWNDEHYAWNALFGYDKKYFLREIEIANDKIMHGVGIFGSHSGVTPIDEKEQRKYEDMTMAQIYKADPEYHKLLKSQVYRKFTNEKGEYFCAITGFTNKSELAFEIDHIKPFSKGGKTRLENLQLVAWWKNREKGAKENAESVENVQKNDSADPQQKSAKPQKSKSEFDLDEIYACKKDELPQLIDSYTNAAHQGKADAQFCLGWLHCTGDAGMTQDYGKAARWFRKSAEQGNIDAQVNLAIMYQQGDGVKQSFKNAAEWFQKAAEQGNTAAQNQLALMYWNGEGVEQNYAKAAEWYQKAAEQGDPDGQNYLGVLYDRGDGVPQDIVKAMELYRLAAEQGHNVAQQNLGLTYYYGAKGIPKNYEQAAFWYRKSAEQGNRSAQKRLARLYAKGIGVDEDLVLAYAWFCLAYDGKNENAKEYREVKEKLSEKQLKEGQKAVEVFRKIIEDNQNANQ